MAQIVCILLNTDDRTRLEAIAGDRNHPLKHIYRVRFILCSALRHPVQEVAPRADASRPAVWRWQRRFAEESIDGLLRDKTRKPGKASLGKEIEQRIVTLTCAEPSHEAPSWTARAMARLIRVTVSTVQRIWKAHDLQPRRLQTFKRSTDLEFVSKLDDIVGLHMNPHALVWSIDEKAQIQALGRTQPNSPLKPGKYETMTHDYKRHYTTTLFATLNVPKGTVIRRCMQRHRYQRVHPLPQCCQGRSSPGNIIHLILDNYKTHKHPNVQV